MELKWQITNAHQIVALAREYWCGPCPKLVTLLKELVVIAILFLELYAVEEMARTQFISIKIWSDVTNLKILDHPARFLTQFRLEPLRQSDIY